jgi:hypothetical protein
MCPKIARMLYASHDRPSRLYTMGTHLFLYVGIKNKILIFIFQKRQKKI